MKSGLPPAPCAHHIELRFIGESVLRLLGRKTTSMKSEKLRRLKPPTGAISRCFSMLLNDFRCLSMVLGTLPRSCSSAGLDPILPRCPLAFQGESSEAGYLALRGVASEDKALDLDHPNLATTLDISVVAHSSVRAELYSPRPRFSLRGQSHCASTH